MNPSRTFAHHRDETRSGFALQVPGMHRIGTDVLSSTLGFCDACVGATWGMTGDNLQNTGDIWKCRDTHEACDRPLQAARADRWKVVRFRSEAIPLAALNGGAHETCNDRFRVGQARRLGARGAETLPSTAVLARSRFPEDPFVAFGGNAY